MPDDVISTVYNNIVNTSRTILDARNNLIKEFSKVAPTEIAFKALRKETHKCIDGICASLGKLCELLQLDPSRSSAEWTELIIFGFKENINKDEHSSE